MEIGTALNEIDQGFWDLANSIGKLPPMDEYKRLISMPVVEYYDELHNWIRFNEKRNKASSSRSSEWS